jgi:hypothetical protein
MQVIQRVMASWAVVLVGCATQVFAQTGMANMVDHVHLAVPDQAKGVEWYRKHFGGQPMTEAPDRLMFGETRVIFQKNPSAQQWKRHRPHRVLGPESGCDTEESRGRRREGDDARP